MDTTKLTVEYLIIGILVSLAIIFLFSNLAPTEMQALSLAFIQYPSLISTGIVVLLLPIFYGIGIVTEYLGMFLFETYLEKIKEERFGNYISQNLDWLRKNRLLSTFAKGTQSIQKDSGQKMYGEMRFFVLMKNSFLYEEIKAQINRYRILRVLIIVEVLFIVGFVIHFIAKGIDSLSTSVVVTVIILLLITFRALVDRYNRYCRAIEHSFKALALDEFNPKSKQ